MKQKSKYGMPPPSSRAEFEHNVFLFVDDIEKHINDVYYLKNRLRVVGDSLNHLRFLPNRRIGLATIDEIIRIFSNMMDWINYLPPVSIREKSE